MKQRLTLRLKAEMENVPRAVECATKAARKAGFDERAIYQIEVAVDEACANVVEHAYAGLEPGEMEIRCRFDGECLAIRVRDWGKSFDPSHAEAVDVCAALEDRTPGGLGLFLIKRLMDRADFSFDPELGNELLMVKRLQTAG